MCDLTGYNFAGVDSSNKVRKIVETNSQRFSPGLISRLKAKGITIELVDGNRARVLGPSSALDSFVDKEVRLIRDVPGQASAVASPAAVVSSASSSPMVGSPSDPWNNKSHPDYWFYHGAANGTMGSGSYGPGEKIAPSLVMKCFVDESAAAPVYSWTSSGAPSTPLSPMFGGGAPLQGRRHGGRQSSYGGYIFGTPTPTPTPAPVTPTPVNITPTIYNQIYGNFNRTDGLGVVGYGGQEKGIQRTASALTPTPIPPTPPTPPKPPTPPPPVSLPVPPGFRPPKPIPPTPTPPPCFTGCYASCYAGCFACFSWNEPCFAYTPPVPTPPVPIPPTPKPPKPPKPPPWVEPPVPPGFRPPKPIPPTPIPPTPPPGGWAGKISKGPPPMSPIPPEPITPPWVPVTPEPWTPVPILGPTIVPQPPVPSSLTPSGRSEGFSSFGSSARRKLNSG